jgi:hypothetical protein
LVEHHGPALCGDELVHGGQGGDGLFALDVVVVVAVVGLTQEVLWADVVEKAALALELTDHVVVEGDELGDFGDSVGWQVDGFVGSIGDCLQHKQECLSISLAHPLGKHTQPLRHKILQPPTNIIRGPLQKIGRGQLNARNLRLLLIRTTHRINPLPTLHLILRIHRIRQLISPFFIPHNPIIPLIRLQIRVQSHQRIIAGRRDGQHKPIEALIRED